MEIFITKYALTKGIFRAEGSVAAGVAVYKQSNKWYDQYAHGEGKDWTRTGLAAIQRAHQMRVAKIASLKKQIAKLEAMDFKINEEK
mgnify:CR=1 FL=1